jgi:hypothetical protein
MTHIKIKPKIKQVKLNKMLIIPKICYKNKIKQYLCFIFNHKYYQKFPNFK